MEILQLQIGHNWSITNAAVLLVWRSQTFTDPQVEIVSGDTSITDLCQRNLFIR